MTRFHSMRHALKSLGGKSLGGFSFFRRPLCFSCLNRFEGNYPPVALFVAAPTQQLHIAWFFVFECSVMLVVQLQHSFWATA